jgi:4-diphosphocytidyl-2-C-methyl-D-erythritol kinase
MSGALRARAHAKINLSLRVLGSRPDGYHELRTVFQSLALHDTLTIRRTRGPFTLTCDDPGCPADRTNIVAIAAGRLWKAAGKRGAPRGIAIHIAKRIPVRAGLGGGSSDAAAAIRLLGRMWRIDGVRQRAIGARLGADVPYFFEGGTVLGVERGDCVFPLVDRPSSWVVLVLPSFGVSTKEAFGWFDRQGRRRAGKERDNDLEQVVGQHHPEIPRLVRALEKAGASQAAMTGSGSTVFGLFSRRNAAVDAAAALLGGGRRALVTRTLDRESYQRLAAK